MYAEQLILTLTRAMYTKKPPNPLKILKLISFSLPITYKKKITKNPYFFPRKKKFIVHLTSLILLTYVTL